MKRSILIALTVMPGSSPLPDVRQPASTTLSVLLGGGRIYRATGWYSMPCDRLKPFAQAAIGRIGA